MSDPMPPGGTRLDAYWFWSGLPKESEMRRQLADFRGRGFGRIYIQARLSMPRDLYLSEPHIAAYARAVAIMSELGLKAGLYDDYAWTSGQAGGRTVAGADHLRERHLFWASSEGQSAAVTGIGATLAASLGQAARDWIHEGGTPRFGGWEIAGAAMRLPDGSLQDVTGGVRLADGGADGMEALLEAPLPPGARWTVFAAAQAVNSRIVNYLMPEAGARFVEVGLEPLAAVLGPLMPGTLDRVFFDQPAPGLYDWDGRHGNLLNSLPWSSGLRDAIAARGPVALQLAALLEECGPGTGATRSFVYRTVAQLMQDGFLGALRHFCDRRGLDLSGHEILPHVGSFALNGGFRSIDPRVSLATDFFGTDRFRDVTAVDANNLVPQLAPLLGRSVAQAADRKGCEVELYITSERSEARAAGQWDMTPAALRAQLIRLHMLGASRVILHALFADAGDARPEPLANMRFDFAPGYNLQPWWPVMDEMAREAAGLAEFLEAAAPVRQVLVLYPLETALREGPRHAHAAAFGAWCEALAEAGQPPRIIDEAGLAQIREGSLDGVAVAALVLPHVTALADPGSAGRIAALETAGVPVFRGGPDGADLAPLLAGAPEVAPHPGLRWLCAGRDGEGWWRAVLFNDGEAEIAATLRLGTGVLCRHDGNETPAAGEVQLRLVPQGLACLRLREAAPAVAQAELGTEASLQPLAELAAGWTLQTGGAARPVRVDRGWEEQGDSDWSGTGRYQTEFVLERPASLVLDLPGLACAASVRLDGTACRTVWHPPFRLRLGPVAAGFHRLDIDVSNTGANRFHAGTPFGGGRPEPSGLTCPPLLYEETLP
ncbi:carbohydrate-binding protein [Mangrovicoccus sp. HB161399]|uniref:carbohydrate-binding protein n=1 Tax=Mangrovicoccus sp. HB161399 TaxID=2720392 RepID=UPI001551C244|nr:carbohydrate-binding protein [Mangrovicoccus sp. HB161399]